jgi:heat shock protein HslJ
MMACPISPRRCGRALALALSLVVIGPGLASERGFPFGRELFLDTPPIGKARRVPSLEVAADGQATIDLWCASGSGQVTIAGDAIAIVTGPMVETQCSPERLRGDDALREALAAVTTWRRDGEAVVLIGTQTLRYRPATN